MTGVMGGHCGIPIETPHLRPTCPHLLSISILDLIDAVRDAARQAGDIARRHFRSGQDTAARVWFKDGSSPVTEADIAVDTFLKGSFVGSVAGGGVAVGGNRRRPGRLESRLVWIVDPIDGTRAFAGGHPDWSVSIGLVQEGRPVLGVVHAPVHERLYEATRGVGAFCNGIRLSASAHGRIPARGRAQAPHRAFRAPLRLGRAFAESSVAGAPSRPGRRGLHRPWPGIGPIGGLGYRGRRPHPPGSRGFSFGLFRSGPLLQPSSAKAW